MLLVKLDDMPECWIKLGLTEIVRQHHSDRLVTMPVLSQVFEMCVSRVWEQAKPGNSGRKWPQKVGVPELRPRAVTCEDARWWPQCCGGDRTLGDPSCCPGWALCSTSSSRLLHLASDSDRQNFIGRKSVCWKYMTNLIHMFLK